MSAARSHNCGLGRWSIRTCGTPRRASSIASTRPVGPAPTMRMGSTDSPFFETALAGNAVDRAQPVTIYTKFPGLRMTTGVKAPVEMGAAHLIDHADLSGASPAPSRFPATRRLKARPRQARRLCNQIIDALLSRGRPVALGRTGKHTSKASIENFLRATRLRLPAALRSGAE